MFPVISALFYVLLSVRLWLPLKSAELAASHRDRGFGLLILLIYRVISLVIVFVLCLPFIPAVRRQEAFAAGALTGIFISAIDWQIGWNLTADSLPLSLTLVFGVPLIAGGLSAIAVAYAELLWNRHTVR
jgi:hypothetical protein